MNKGKLKEPIKKYLSIAIIPHSSNQVKVFKFTSFYAKLFSILLLFITLITCTIWIVSNTNKENQQLRQSLNDIYSANAQQRKLLDEKTNEIEKLKESDAAYKAKVNETTKEFNKIFKGITDKYLSNQSITKSNRSGDRSIQDFSESVNNLKSTLDNMNKLSNANINLSTDLMESTKKLEKYFDSIPTLWPVNAQVGDDFGYRKDPFTRRKTFHEGLDLDADKGVGIKASATGKVILAGRFSGYGLAVIIDHGKGLSTLYGHTSKLLVKEGQLVKKGDLIAKVGSTGRSTGPHLHFEVRLFNEPVDPMKYLDIK